MAKCRNCGAEIEFRKDRTGKTLPMDISHEEISVHECSPALVAALSAEGRIVKGKQVGDAYEGGYEIGRRIHTCRK
jgi:hypothetical protein